MLSLLQNAVRFPLGAEGYLFPVESNFDVLTLYANAIINVSVSFFLSSLLFISLLL